MNDILLNTVNKKAQLSLTDKPGRCFRKRRAVYLKTVRRIQ